MNCIGCGTEKSDRWFIGLSSLVEGSSWGTCSACAFKIELDARCVALKNKIEELELELSNTRIELGAAYADLGRTRR